MANTSLLTDIETYTTRRLDYLKFCVQEVVSMPALRDTLALRPLLDQITLGMVLQLTGALCKERATIRLKPATWWDAFKEHFAMWMPMWLTEPVYETIDMDRCYTDIAPIPGRPYVDVVVKC